MKRSCLKLSWLLLIPSLLFVGCKDDSNADQKPHEKEEVVLPPVEIQLDTLLTSLSNPWGIEFLDLNRILFTERSGKLYLLQDGNVEEVTGLPAIVASGQGGLLDVVKHPDFGTNSWIYFSASTGSASANSTALFRATISGTQLSDLVKLFQADPMNGSTAHYGSRIAFDNDGHIYLSLGERNMPATSQETTNHNGCVIRLKDDGGLPTDNPFYGSRTHQQEIWTYGHRNVQGMAVHPETGQIWTHEHGPKGGDEINILSKGSNYGWPLATYGVNYDGTIISEDTVVDGTIAPIYYWVPSIAPCGMNFYNSDSIPQWKGHLFLGALAKKHLNHLTISGEEVIEEERLLEGSARFRQVKQGMDGYLYMLTERPGMLLRYRPKK